MLRELQTWEGTWSDAAGGHCESRRTSTGQELVRPADLIRIPSTFCIVWPSQQYCCGCTALSESSAGDDLAHHGAGLGVPASIRVYPPVVGLTFGFTSEAESQLPHGGALRLGLPTSSRLRPYFDVELVSFWVVQGLLGRDPSEVKRL